MDFAAARHNMVESQIRTNRVTDPLILDAMADLPREAFVPEAMKGVAYVDEAIALGSGRWLMEPMVLARLLQEAEVAADEVALLVGVGSGYEAAVLSKMAGAVVALESDAAMAANASKVLSGLGIDTVAVVEGGLPRGYARQAPYDVIIVNGAVPEVPKRLTEQLADGGRLLCVVVGAGPAGKAMRVTNYSGALSVMHVFDAGIPMLPEFAPEPSFRF